MKDSEIHESLKCPICIEYAEIPTECQECYNIFCYPCLFTEDQKFKFKDCPMCRKNPNFKESQFAKRLILNIQVECPNKCGDLVSRGELKDHLIRCATNLLECSLCSSQYKEKEFFQHLITNHKTEIISQFIKKNKIEDLLSEKINLNEKDKSTLENFTQTDFEENIIKEKEIQNNNKSSLIVSNNELSDIINMINKKGNKVTQGMFGLFYCGKKSDVICVCCDGNCGPDNGCVCSNCMEYNIRSRNLPLGYLINDKGRSANFINSAFYCDVSINKQKGFLKKLFSQEKCSPLYRSCDSCKKLNTLSKFYK